MNIILKLYNKINAMPKRRKEILLIILWCLAPIEMLCITGLYKVIKCAVGSVQL